MSFNIKRMVKKLWYSKKLINEQKFVLPFFQLTISIHYKNLFLGIYEIFSII